MLRIDGVTKSYRPGAPPAVNGLSLHVLPGEIYGFLGPNGAGKTTTIKMIAGLLTPDSGKVSVGDFDVATAPVDAKRTMSYVPDDPELFDKLTGLEYLNFIADVYGVSQADRARRAGRLLEMFELQKAVRDLIGSYSHGMRQKLALTAAMVPAPRLLVLDEPMVGLDPRSAHLFKSLMNEHCSSGGSVFFSTHVLDVAERLCHRVGIINKGRLIASGTIDDLKRLQQVAAEGSSGDTTLEELFLALTSGSDSVGGAR
ncbi:MAG: ABC-type transporter ATP-binding protein EcsA [Firmicutes bacterium ADurb.Bin506]|nr:MAG: ABC-type transporter ATP-binding protein EcsA [Firmicutes bacterium ADurb.Bin506]